MYANGADAPPEESCVDFGKEYESLNERRNQLERFKRGIDISQKHCDTVMRLGIQMEKKKSGAHECQYQDAKRIRVALLDDMWKQAEAFEEQAKRENHLGDIAVSRVMLECVEAYRRVPILRQALQELAADATRKLVKQWYW